MPETNLSSGTNLLENTPLDIKANKQQCFIGSIDCGTTSSRFLIFGKDGNPVATYQVELRNIHKSPG